MNKTIDSLTLANAASTSVDDALEMLRDSVKNDQKSTYQRTLAIVALKANADYSFKAKDVASAVGVAPSTVSLWVALVPVVQHGYDAKSSVWASIVQNIGSTSELRALFTADKKPLVKDITECIARHGKAAKAAARLAEKAGHGAEGKTDLTEGSVTDAKTPSLVVELTTSERVARLLADTQFVVKEIKAGKIDATNLGRLEHATAAMAKALGAQFAVAERVTA